MRWDYSRLLLDRRWQRKRLITFDDAGWKCDKCGNDDDAIPLHAHHRIYITGRMPWEYGRADIAALCDPCHSEEHGKRPSDPALEYIEGQMREAHERKQWDRLRDLADEAQRLMEQGLFYRGLL